MSSSTFTLGISDETFGVIDDDDWPHDSALDHNGLVTAMSRGALIYTGINMGLVNIEVRVLDQPPAALDLDGWDEVIEISFRAPAGRAQVVAMEDIPENSPLVTRSGPGEYRLRVHAKGRDIDPDGVAEEPFETYLLAFWPAVFDVEIIHKATDAVGRGRRDYSKTFKPDPATRQRGYLIREDIQDGKGRIIAPGTIKRIEI